MFSSEIQKIANDVERIADNMSSGSGGGGTSGGGPLTVYIIPYEGEDPNDEYEALSLTADEENPVMLTPNDVFNADGTLKTTLTVLQRFSSEDEGLETIGFNIMQVHSMFVETQEASMQYCIIINNHMFLAEGAQSYFVFDSGGK